MATPTWFNRLSATQKKAVLAAQSSNELLTYLKGQGISLAAAERAELAAGVNVGRSFGVWLKNMLEQDRDDATRSADTAR